MRASVIALSILLLLQTVLGGAQQSVSVLSYQDARSVVQALSDVLPAPLQGIRPEAQAAAWSRWVNSFHDALSERLLRGEEDTLAYFLIFGVSFSRQPRLAAADLRPDLRLQTQKIVQGRIEDLLRALADPEDNDRVWFFRSFLTRKGFRPGNPVDSEKLREYLTANLTRVIRESASYAAALEAARRIGDASAEFAERSTLFHDRGLSPDTSLRPNLAVDQSLRALKDQGFLAPAGIRRVAVIGPGLDFTDKDAGYDYYPPQTIQPFALIDSLARLGLASAANLDVTTLDVSLAVNDHIMRARGRASEGTAYALQLPRDARIPWKPEFLRYWETFGNQLGTAAPPVPPPAVLPGIVSRAVRIRPDVVLRIQPVTLNIVTQHLELSDAQRFDLILATNVFVYYDVFQQSLALVNVARMLRPGGFLLSNNALLELPDSKIRSAGYQTSVYSDRQADGDHIVWYRYLPAIRNN